MSNETKPANQKAPDQWATGDQPMTKAQASYLKNLCAKVGEDFDETLTKAQASKRIDQLRQRTNQASQAAR